MVGLCLKKVKYTYSSLSSFGVNIKEIILWKSYQKTNSVENSNPLTWIDYGILNRTKSKKITWLTWCYSPIVLVCIMVLQISRGLICLFLVPFINFPPGPDYVRWSAEHNFTVFAIRIRVSLNLRVFVSLLYYIPFSPTMKTLHLQFEAIFGNLKSE